MGSNPLIDGKTSLQPVFLTTQKAICFLGFIITQLSLYQTLSSKKEEEDRLMLRIGVQQEETSCKIVTIFGLIGHFPHRFCHYFDECLRDRRLRSFNSP